jgi:hypothetical protein
MVLVALFFGFRNQTQGLQPAKPVLYPEPHPNFLIVSVFLSLG